MNYKTIEFLTYQGLPMTIEAADVHALNEEEEVRYRDGRRLVHSDTLYEITKTWADDDASYLKVWLLKLETLQPQAEKMKPPRAEHQEDKW